MLISKLLLLNTNIYSTLLHLYLLTNTLLNIKCVVIPKKSVTKAPGAFGDPFKMIADALKKKSFGNMKIKPHSASFTSNLKNDFFSRMKENRESIDKILTALESLKFLRINQELFKNFRFKCCGTHHIVKNCANLKINPLSVVDTATGQVDQLVTDQVTGQATGQATDLQENIDIMRIKDKVDSKIQIICCALCLDKKEEAVKIFMKYDYRYFFDIDGEDNIELTHEKLLVRFFLVELYDFIGRYITYLYCIANNLIEDSNKKNIEIPVELVRFPKVFEFEEYVQEIIKMSKEGYSCINLMKSSNDKIFQHIIHKNKNMVNTMVDNHVRHLFGELSEEVIKNVFIRNNKNPLKELLMMDDVKKKFAIFGPIQSEEKND